jgi:hypothetical protein
MSPPASHAGGCLCGAVRYVLAGAPTSTNICYCTQCQRQTGAPVPSFASCRSEQLTVLQGDVATYRASERARRQFCATCGSTLFWRANAEDCVDIFLGSFDEPNRLPSPQYAIWAEHRPAWVPELADVPTFPRDRGEGAPMARHGNG